MKLALFYHKIQKCFFGLKEFNQTYLGNSVPYTGEVYLKLLVSRRIFDINLLLKKPSSIMKTKIFEKWWSSSRCW